MPAQTNSYDCGLYTLHFVETLMNAPVERLQYHLVSLAKETLGIDLNEYALHRPRLERKR